MEGMMFSVSFLPLLLFLSHCFSVFRVYVGIGSLLWLVCPCTLVLPGLQHQKPRTRYHSVLSFMQSRSLQKVHPGTMTEHPVSVKNTPINKESQLSQTYVHTSLSRRYISLSFTSSALSLFILPSFLFSWLLSKCNSPEIKGLVGIY